MEKTRTARWTVSKYPYLYHKKKEFRSILKGEAPGAKGSATSHKPTDATRIPEEHVPLQPPRVGVLLLALNKMVCCGWFL